MENLKYVAQNKPVNYELNNAVDKDVQAMLLPLNMIQSISLSPRYRIKNNYITQNSFITTLFSIVGALTCIGSYVFRTFWLLHYQVNLGFTTFTAITAFFDCISYCIGFITNFIIGVAQIKNNIKFVILFQRVHRLLNNESSFNHFIIWNWIMIIIAFAWYFTIMTTSYFYTKLSVPWYFLLIGYLLIIFDINVVHAIRVLKLLEMKLDLWNHHVTYIIAIENRPGEYTSKEMFHAFVDILECYNILTVCSQPSILYYIIHIFFHSLCYIQVNIERLKVGLMHHTNGIPLGLLSVFCWVVKNLTWQTMFMQRCDAFYIAVENVQDSCTLIMKSNCSDKEKKLYKNVLRVHRASFRKMRVCGLFYADAALQLSLMSLLANYTIVLLQFAFL